MLIIEQFSTLFSTMCLAVAFVTRKGPYKINKDLLSVDTINVFTY